MVLLEIHQMFKGHFMNELEQRYWCRFDVFIVNFEQTSHIVLVFPLLALNK